MASNTSGRFIKALRKAVGHEDILAFFFFVAVSFYFTSPVYENFSLMGRDDWDTFYFFYAVFRDTIIRYHQIPLWNPYAYGGDALHAYPNLSYTNLSTALVLFFGVVKGLKIGVTVHALIGMAGLYVFSKSHLGLKGIPALMPPTVYMLSSIYPLNISIGHYHWVAMAWIPWTLHFHLKSLENIRYSIHCAFSLLLTFLDFSYFFIYSVLVLTAHDIIKVLDGVLSARKPSVIPHSLIILKSLTLTLILVALLGSFKFLPMFEYLKVSNRGAQELDGMPVSAMKDALLGRNQRFTSGYPFEGRKWEWPAYGAYVGVIPLTLALFGVVISFKEKWILVILLALSLLISLGNQSPINIWDFLRLFPFFKSLHVSTRFLAFFVLFLSMFSGMGLASIQGLSGLRCLKSSRILRAVPRFILPALILLFVVHDLKAVGVSDINFSTFTDAEPARVGNDFTQGLQNIKAMYRSYLNNTGSVNAYYPVHLPAKAKTRYDPEYRGETYLEGGGRAAITYFSPNRLVVSVDSGSDDTLVVNQNYFTGWRSSGLNGARVEPHEGLLSVKIPPGRTDVTLYYLPASFLAGLSVSIITLVLCAYVLLTRK